GAGQRATRQREPLDRRSTALRPPILARLELGARRADSRAHRVDRPRRHDSFAPRVTGRMRPGRDLRDALRSLPFKGLSLALERACGLGVVVVAAPRLGEAGFGRYAFGSTVTALLAFGTDLGLGLWTTRTLARHDDER